MRKHICEFRSVLLSLAYHFDTNIANRPVSLVEHTGRKKTIREGSKWHNKQIHKTKQPVR